MSLSKFSRTGNKITGKEKMADIAIRTLRESTAPDFGYTASKFPEKGAGKARYPKVAHSTYINQAKLCIPNVS